MPNFIEIEEIFCGRTDGRTDGHLRPTLLRRLRRFDIKPSSSEETIQANVREGCPAGRSETTGVGFVKQVGFKPAVKERGSNG